MHEDYIKSRENSFHFGCEYIKVSNDKLSGELEKL